MRRQALSSSGVRGITQDELAQRTALSQPRISQIEKGTGRDGITYAVLRKIAYACGIEWGDLLRAAIDAASSQKQQTGTEKTLAILPAATMTDAQPVELPAVTQTTEQEATGQCSYNIAQAVPAKIGFYMWDPKTQTIRRWDPKTRSFVAGPSISPMQPFGIFEGSDPRTAAAPAMGYVLYQEKG
jgi:transcriptional regulator with XRE-family HTH domain